jgi:hypothetical protein
MMSISVKTFEHLFDVIYRDDYDSFGKYLVNYERGLVDGILYDGYHIIDLHKLPPKNTCDIFTHNSTLQKITSIYSSSVHHFISQLYRGI